MKASRILAIFLLVISSFIFTPAQNKAARKIDQPATMVSERLPEKEEPDAAPVESTGDPNSLIALTTYPMTVLGGWPLENMSGGTTQLIAPSTDNDNSALSPIGFTFRFDDVNFTTFGVNGNGFLSLGIIPTGTNTQNSISFAANAPKIMPFWDNLCVGPNGKVHYKTIGAAGSRKLIVEWQNMQITRNGACLGQGGGTFQLWLLETTGVIQFVYGNGITGSSPNDNGYSIGLQSGVGSNFASVTTASGSVSYTLANDTQSPAIPVGTSYVFAPNVPPPPSFGSVTAITQTSLQLNWTDNASTETFYQISRSTDNVNFIVLGVLPANSIGFGDNGLLPGTQYFYRVNALSEGAISQDLALSATTNPAGNISSTSAGGPWSAPATWSGGVVPAAGDNVTIIDGSTVTIDTAALALNITIGSTGALSESEDKQSGASPAAATFEETTARSLTVTQNVLIKSNGVFATAASGNVTGHVLSVGGNLTNNGSLDFSTSNDQAGAGINFTGASNNSFGGTGPVTDIRTITMNKGTARENTLELNTANFTVQGSTAEAPGSGYLTITNGTFKISGTFTGGHRTFATANYNIPNNGGFWLNNPNYTVAAQNGSPNVFGIFRVTNGTYNVGTANGDSINFGTNSAVTIEGGAINTAGRFGVASPGNFVWSYNQSGGTITACTIGHAVTTAACFDTGVSAASAVAISGGSIVIQNRSTAASGPRDYRHLAGTTGQITLTGGTVKFGNSLTAGASTFSAVGQFPNMEIDNTTGGHTVNLQPAGGFNNVTRNLTINTGTTFNIGGNAYLMHGSTLVNNGTLTANAAGANLVWFNSTGNATYSGTGVSTGIMTNFSLQGQNVTLAGTNNIRVRNVNIFSGNIINSSKLTLGNNDATVNAVQFGNTVTPTPAGVFDSAPVFDLGTGGQTVRYLRTGDIRTTGPEINPGRTLVGLTYDNDDPLTDELNVAGGDLTVTGAMLLTNGEIKTGSNKITHNGTVTRVAGFINGTLNRTYTAVGNYTYHVGVNGYSPAVFMLGNIGTPPTDLSVKPIDTTLPGLDPAVSASRYWEVHKTGAGGGRMTFTYTDADINGDETTYGAWVSMGGGNPSLDSQSNDPPSNTVLTAQPLTIFEGNWGIGNYTVPRTVSGFIRTANGQPIRNAIVKLADFSVPSQTISVQTGNLGQYAFFGVLTGRAYTLSASAKRFRFAPPSREIVVNGDDFTQDFTASPQFEKSPVK